LPSIEGLKIFCDVARQRSFSLAASANLISQSAASQAVVQIEKQLGVRLIDRRKRPLALTAEGKIFFDECRDLVERYLAVESQIRARKENVAARVNIASIYSLVPYNLNQYAAAFMRSYPKGTIRFRYLHPDDVYDNVVSEQADFGLLSFPKATREIDLIPWREEPMVVVCSSSHRFAGLETAGVEALNGEDFVAFEVGLAIRRSVDRFLHGRSISVNIVSAFDNIEAIKRAVEAIGGVSILPEPTVRAELESGALRVVPMPDLDLSRPLSIIFRKKRVLTPAMLTFLEILQESEAVSAAE
jgi:DNA-binding transcriptional LysR family regulator